MSAALLAVTYPVILKKNGPMLGLAPDLPETFSKVT